MTPQIDTVRPGSAGASDRFRRRLRRFDVDDRVEPSNAGDHVLLLLFGRACRPESDDRLGVELASARFGDPQELPDLAERVVLLVVELKKRLEPLGQLLHGPREALSPLASVAVAVPLGGLFHATETE